MGVGEIHRRRREKPSHQQCQGGLGPRHHGFSPSQQVVARLHSHGGEAEQCASCPLSVREMVKLRTGVLGLEYVHRV